MLVLDGHNPGLEDGRHLRTYPPQTLPESWTRWCEARVADALYMPRALPVGFRHLSAESQISVGYIMVMNAEPIVHRTTLEHRSGSHYLMRSFTGVGAASKGDRLRLLRIAVAGLVAAAGLQAQYVNARLKRNNPNVRSVVVLPAQVEIRTAGGSPLIDESVKLGVDLTSIVIDFLKSKGANVMPALVESQAVQKSYDAIDHEITKHPQGITKGHYTIGSIADVATAADTLVFIRGRGTVTVPLEKIMANTPSPLMWFTKDQAFEGRIVFADSHSGEVLLLIPFTTFGHGWKKTAEELRPRIASGALPMRPPIHEIIGEPAH
jgi:hypothetical protein